jgi:hypothetical protein
MRNYLFGAHSILSVASALSGDGMAIDIDVYYRGLASERLHEMGDRMLNLSREAEQASAHNAAMHLADVATQLEGMAREASPHTPEAF